MYSDLIVERSESPSNFGKLKHSNKESGFVDFCEGESSSSCGDHIVMYVDVKDGVINDIKFEGEGCMLSVASTDLLIDECKGKTVEEVLKMDKDDVVDMLGFDVGINRVKCIMIGLRTLQKALK